MDSVWDERGGLRPTFLRCQTLLTPVIFRNSRRLDCFPTLLPGKTSDPYWFTSTRPKPPRGRTQSHETPCIASHPVGPPSWGRTKTSEPLHPEDGVRRTSRPGPDPHGVRRTLGVRWTTSTNKTVSDRTDALDLPDPPVRDEVSNRVGGSTGRGGREGRVFWSIRSRSIREDPVNGTR